ncbi:MAG: hypothetical protein AB7T31_16820 [Gemmatimonadales bacterium]
MAPHGPPPHDITYRPRPGRDVTFSGGGGGAGYGAPNFTVGAPTVERPPLAQDFNLFGTLASRTAANTPALFTGARFQIPAGRVGVIRSLSILANSLLVTSDVRWAVLFNANAEPGWNALTINPRAAGSVEVSWTPEETFIPVPEGATIDFRVTVLDAGTYQVSVAAHGWHYPVELEIAAAQSWIGG